MQNFRRYGLLVVLALISAFILAACGDNTATSPAATTVASSTKSATTSVLTTTVAATTSASTTSGNTVASTGKKLKVGLVTDIGRVTDRSFNQSAWEDVQKAKDELGAEVKYIETTDTKDYAKNIQAFVDEKYDVIVSVGFLLGDATIEAAKANPGIKFIGVDQFQAAAISNLSGIIFDEDKSGFLAGVLAAGMSKSGKVAAVLGPKSVTPVLKFGEGYKAGAEYLLKTNPKLVPSGKIDVSLTYHSAGDNAFIDPTWGSQQSQALIQSGNDVIFGAGGITGNGAVEGAAEKGVYVIGVDKDQYFDLTKAAPKMLSSATKLIRPSVFNNIKSVFDGNFKGGNFIGAVGLAPFHDTEKDVPSDLKAFLTSVENGLKDGSIKTGVVVS